MSDTASDPYDVVIIGGGLVGATLALALRPLALKVALLEAHPPAPATANLSTPCQPSFDARASALSWGTRCIYQRLGLWDALTPHAYPIKHIEVSERGYLGRSHLSAAEQQVEALGYVVPNAWLGQHLWDTLKASNVTYYTPAELQRITFPTPASVKLEASTPTGTVVLNARLVVVADGGRSRLKQQLGIADHVHHYHQSAIVANVTLSRAHQSWAYERFTQHGALALLPMQARQMTLVWTHPHAAAQTLMALEAQAFMDQLQQEIGARVGRIEQLSERFIYPLQKRQAREQVRRRLVLLGNAAHYLHPVAGQGYNLAARGVMSLVETLALGQQRAIDQVVPFDPGDLARLETWVQRRQQDQKEVINFSHGLITVFGQPQSWLAHARAAGLMGLNLVGPVRRWLAYKAMGGLN